jgi:hypothetical protein
VGACAAFAGFAVSVVGGMAAENPLDVVLTRAIVAMAACGVVGWLCGAAAESAVASRLAELSTSGSAPAPPATAPGLSGTKQVTS